MFCSWKYSHYFEFVSAKDDNIKVRCTLYYLASKTLRQIWRNFWNRSTAQSSLQNKSHQVVLSREQRAKPRPPLLQEDVSHPPSTKSGTWAFGIGSSCPGVYWVTQWSGSLPADSWRFAWHRFCPRAERHFLCYVLTHAGHTHPNTHAIYFSVFIVASHVFEMIFDLPLVVVCFKDAVPVCSPTLVPH